MYAVIQTLPMVVVDVSGVRWTDGVEYFLCQPPRSGVPWAREDTSAQRSWYGIIGTTDIVSLPTDTLEHSVEGVYHRSHCWEVASIWTSNSQIMTAALQETMQGTLPQAGLLHPGRTQSPDRRRESVMNLGLEALPVPAGAPVSTSMRPKSSNDPTKTFDAILQSTAAENANNSPKGKKSKK